MNLKQQQADIVEIKDNEEEGVFRCHICKAFGDNPINVRSHIHREHPYFVFICSDPSCFKAYVTRSRSNKHKQKYLDQSEDFPIYCLFLNKDSKQKSCVMNICVQASSKLQKAQKQEEQNGSVKPSGEDPTVEKEEPQLEPKLLENKTVDSSKKKPKLHQYSQECSEVDLKNKLKSVLFHIIRGL